MRTVGGTLEHAVLFYDAESFLLDSVAAYLSPALKDGRRAVMICTADHAVGIQERLHGSGVDLTSAQANGSLVVRDARETLARFMIGSVPQPDLFDRVVDELFEGVSSDNPPLVFGEMVALLVGDGLPRAALALEGLWSRVQERYRFSLLCAYPMQHFQGEALTPLVFEELHRALEAERAARDAAEAALRVRDEFLSTASHELRTPLAVLSVQAQVLLRRWERTGEIEPERLAQGLQTIATQSSKLGRLVSQLLDISRMDAGKLALDRTSVDLVDLVSNVVRSTQNVSDGRQIGLRAPERLVCRVDPLRIEQVLVNLLDNALKYSSAQEMIEVGLEATDCEVHLVVRDGGPGIPPDKRDRIFERFFQANTNGMRTGLGLGLYVSRTIVELHGGSIHAEFPDDGGTRFVVHLPVSASSSPI